MNDDAENLNTSLIETVPINNRTCCFYLFCCCLCCSKEKTDSRDFYIRKWRTYLAKETDSKKRLNDPFRILTNLWAHKNVIKDLELIRLNPNLLNRNQIRNDLEFYIPQLCTFLLFGEYEAVEEFLAFLCKACYASFYFAHRIVWFLKSLLHTNSLYNEKIKNILHIIQTIFKSENKNNILERLHVAGSKNFIDYLNNLSILPIYFIKELGEISPIQQNFIERIKEVREKLDINIDENYSHIVNKEEKKLENVLKLNKDEVYVNIFKRYGSVTNDEENINTQYLNQIDVDDINLSSFLSTVNFIDHLCNICEIIRFTNPIDQHKTLLNELKKVNKILPANIYIPFTNESIRYYVVCNIPISEAKIFKTKNRAPFMITIEAIRLEEITDKTEVKEFIRTHAKTTLKKVDKKKKKRKESYHSGRSHSFSESNLKQNDFNIDKRKKENKLNTFIERKENVNINNDYLQEADIKLSKPILIKNIYNLDNSVNISKNKKNIKELDESDYITDVNEYKKIDDFVKRRVTLGDQSEYSINILKNTEHLFDLDETKIKKTKDNRLNQEIIIENRQNSEEDNNEESMIIGDKNERFSINTSNDSIFGEKIEEQTERLRKISPFGNLSTFKLFKLIVKSGEDLRQEQFATQLINEFYQIFKAEKVDCWVNTYEILATGNDVGIIEVVPNSISLDQLFRRVKNYSNLATFYQTYFGPVNSMTYKTAMDNFISSLAGYSLVCYFLQIKDRHNANILVDNQGHLIHIDFGFMLSNAPGKGLQFEKAPFKLTKEFVDVLGGVNSKYFNKFRKLLWKGFLALVSNCEKILILVEMMFCGHGNKLPCFEKGQSAINELRNRFIPRSNMKTRDYIRHIDSLIEQSIDNWRTKWYDKYQYWVQGIFY